MRIEETITLENRYLTSKYKQHIKTALDKKLSGRCTKEIGYVIDVLEIVAINQKLTTTAVTVFNVECEVTTFLPTSGDIIQCNVLLCLKHGVLLTTMGGIHNVFLPASQMVGYTFQNDMFVDKQGKTTIQKNDQLEVELAVIRFDAIKMFSSTCKLLKKI